MQVNIHPIVTIYICTLLAWAKCFLAPYGEYQGLYDLLDTPRCYFLASQLHLCDSTFPRPLLPRSRGPPTLQNECVALQPHLAPPTPPDCHATCPSITTSVCHATSLSVITSDPSVCQSTHPYVKLSVHHTDMSICHTTSPSVCKSTRMSVALSVCDTVSPSIIPIHPSYNQSIHHPVNSLLTRQSVTPPISSMIRQFHDPSIRPSIMV